jgi:Domain of unknown function (DUF4337)
MEGHELLESSEQAQHAGNRRIGVTMALFAAALAVVTMMGHRLHTEEVVMQTQVADGWAYYQAKNSRSQMYAADAQLAALQGAAGAATSKTWVEKAAAERKDADEIRHSTEELDRETKTTAERASRFDEAEVFLEIAIVLCSVALLTGSRGFWLVSFAGAAAAVVLGAIGAMHR